MLASSFAKTVKDLQTPATAPAPEPAPAPAGPLPYKPLTLGNGQDAQAQPQLKPWMARLALPREERAPDLVATQGREVKKRADAKFLEQTLTDIQQSQAEVDAARGQVQGLVGQATSMQAPQMAPAGERTLGEGVAGLVGGLAGGFGEAQQASLAVAGQRHATDFANAQTAYSAQRENISLQLQVAQQAANDAAHRLATAVQKRDSVMIQSAQDDYEFSLKQAETLQKQQDKLDIEDKKQKGRIAIEQLKAVNQSEKTKQEAAKEYEFMVNTLGLSPEQAAWNIQQKYENLAAQANSRNAYADNIPKQLELSWWKARNDNDIRRTANAIAQERVNQDESQFNRRLTFDERKQIFDEAMAEVKGMTSSTEKDRVKDIRSFESGELREAKEAIAMLAVPYNTLAQKVLDAGGEENVDETTRTQYQEALTKLNQAKAVYRERTKTYNEMLTQHAELKRSEKADADKAKAALEDAKKKVSSGKPQYMVSQEDWDRYAPKRKQVLDLETKAFMTFGTFKTGRTNARMIQDTNTPSLHSYGAALDMHGDRLQDKADWAIQQPGVKVVIYNRQIWTPGKGWRKKTTGDPHTDHVHVDYGR